MYAASILKYNYYQKLHNDNIYCKCINIFSLVYKKISFNYILIIKLHSEYGNRSYVKILRKIFEINF